MDEYTACEQAYKNGYEQGKKDAAKRGSWKTNENEYGVTICACSECGEEYSSGVLPAEEMIKMLKYCPNCGADMRGDTQ